MTDSDSSKTRPEETAEQWLQRWAHEVQVATANGYRFCPSCDQPVVHREDCPRGNAQEVLSALAASRAREQALTEERDQLARDFDAVRNVRDDYYAQLCRQLEELQAERDKVALLARSLALLNETLGERSWQPIETAPKDGTRVLLWWPHWSKATPVVGRYIHGDWDSYCRMEGDMTPPTLWQPLPPAPAVTP